jgi:hypothetical protein
LKKDIEDTRRWKDLPCSQIRRTNTAKTVIVLKAICRFIAMHTKIPMLFFTEFFLKILKLMQKHKQLQISKAILSKKSNAGGRII